MLPRSRAGLSVERRYCHQHCARISRRLELPLTHARPPRPASRSPLHAADQTSAPLSLACAAVESGDSQAAFS